MIKIVGAGITGLILARRFAENNIKVVLYDANNYVGGLLFDYEQNGFFISKSGVHIFHTNDKKKMEYLTKFGTFVAYNHVVSADVYGTNFAINFPPTNNNRLTKKQFENLYYYYSLKQWGKMPSQKILDRCKAKTDNSLYFFRDKYVAIPLNGWAEVCNKLASHPNIKVKLNYDFNIKDIEKDDKIYFSGRLDRLYNYKYGEMKYRTVEIKNISQGDDFANVMNKSLPNCEYTRIINWRRCSAQISIEEDLYGYEYSRCSNKNEIAPHYIVDGQEDIYKKYLNECKKDNIIPIGRIGSNKYMNIEDGMECAMNLPL